jgi:hypothetical protein
MAEGYCSFKTDRGMYISPKKFKSHKEAAKWVSAEIKARGIKASDIKGNQAGPSARTGSRIRSIGAANRFVRSRNYQSSDGRRPRANGGPSCPFAATTADSPNKSQQGGKALPPSWLGSS